MLSQAEQWLLTEKYGGEKSSGFFADCERLAAGEPLGYVIGHVPFLGCTIYLDSNPLIPRPETEFWVEKAIEVMKEISNKKLLKHPQRNDSERVPTETISDLKFPFKVLDLCAGSGCIGVAVAKHMPVAKVDFGEIDSHLLPTIAQNLSANDIDSTRYRVWQSDLYKNLADRYDFILSNPPYIDPALDRAEPAVKDHEPHQALYGGTDGLALIEQIIREAPDHLTPQGQIWIEHEPEQVLAIAELAHTHGFTISTHGDQYGIERYSVLVLQ